MELPKNYDPKQAEVKWQKYWQENDIYKFNFDEKKETYAIDTPPPTVSGKMHIGHAFSYSQQDFVARYHRMSGKNVFYPFGTDDNGLPTERLVEKSKKVRARDMSREDFIKVCNEFLKEELPKFIYDWKRIGISCDFNIYYSTINEHCRRISQWSFLDLYKKGRMERKDSPSMWCPECQTGVAQVEVKDKDIESTFNTIIFKVGKEDLHIATTRPELLPACVAVFYNPEDSRFKKYNGKKAKVPLFDFEVPIMEDIRADPEKGTGIVMCCTFGDQTDMEWQKAHNLPIKEALTRNGRISEIAGKYAGLSIKEAREQIINDLKESGLLIKQEKITHSVNVHERCSREIEFIKSRQWFVRYLDLRDDMLEWGNKLKWYPQFMKTRYDNWVKGLQWDWLISNQRYFGVPFPVWYCKKCGEVILAEENQLPVNPLTDKPLKNCRCGSSDFDPEKDILNTWFTSSMTPQLAVKLMHENIQKKIFPMALRPQAHEIITFWLFNTVFKSNIHFGKNPWKDVMISGFVTLGGEKMSKSKGNIVEPQAVIEKYGADALRYWAAGSKLGEDLDYQEKDLVAGQRFITKFWNASKFAIMHLNDYDGKKPKALEAFDRWILSKLNILIKASTESFEEYEYSKTKMGAEKFFWQLLCDNYLEIIKDRLYNPDRRGKEQRTSAQFALYNSLLSCLKLMAPITPHFTEEIYHLYFAEKEKFNSVHLSNWPKADKKLVDEEIEKAGDMAIEIIVAVRKFKAEKSLSLKEDLKLLKIDCKDKKLLEPFIDDLKATTRALDIVFEKTSAIELNPELKIEIIK